MGSSLDIREWTVYTHPIERCPGFNIVRLVSYVRHVAEERSRHNCRDCQLLQIDILSAYEPTLTSW